MNPTEFIEAIQAASDAGTLEYEYKPHCCTRKRVKVKLTLSHYGGGRLDRLAERNRITGMFGLEAKGRQFWSLDEEDGCGSFLANVLAGYGDTDWLLINGQRVPLVSDLTWDGGSYIGLMPINAIPEVTQ